MVIQTFENLNGLVWCQSCWRATIFQYNTIENVKNSLANNTDQNALQFDTEAKYDILSIIRILICVIVILMTSYMQTVNHLPTLIRFATIRAIKTAYGHDQNFICRLMRTLVNTVGLIVLLVVFLLVRNF